MELAAALQILVAVAMPFILYILNGIRKSVHDIRDTLQTTVTKTAVLEERVNRIEGAPRPLRQV